MPRICARADFAILRNCMADNCPCSPRRQTMVTLTNYRSRGWYSRAANADSEFIVAGLIRIARTAGQGRPMSALGQKRTSHRLRVAKAAVDCFMSAVTLPLCPLKQTLARTTRAPRRGSVASGSFVSCCCAGTTRHGFVPAGTDVVVALHVTATPMGLSCNRAADKQRRSAGECRADVAALPVQAATP